MAFREASRSPTPTEREGTTQKRGISVFAALKRRLRAIRHGVTAGARWIGRQAVGLGRVVRYGDWRTRTGLVIMGAGSLLRGQWWRGGLYLLAQFGYIAYMLGFGGHYVRGLHTLGTVPQGKTFDAAEGIYRYTEGDNSMKILLFGVLSLVLTAIMLYLYLHSLRAGWRAQVRKANGKPLVTLREDWQALFDRRYHVTLLTLPILLVTAFTLLPLIFMVLIAFTNFDKTHQPPGNLFTWVGWSNFTDLLGGNPQLGHTFVSLLVWTLTWAVLATATNYLGGMLLALMINKKGIRLKRLWRTTFIVTIAVPQFVSLMLMSQLLADEGALNVLLRELGWITSSVPFLTDGVMAKLTVVVVNLWVGVPYTMLITSGILMNIPEDMYESARIDGAGPVRMFFRITLPYMLFVTTPYLITQFVGNINNFNVIYLLTKGGPLTLDYYKAGKTDLLVTWLYKQTVEEQQYNLAAVIGVIVFLITAIGSLLTYNATASAQKEEEFQ